MKVQQTHTVALTDYIAHLSCVINIKYYLKNDLYGEESSKDMVCIAQDLKTQQKASLSVFGPNSSGDCLTGTLN